LGLKVNPIDLVSLGNRAHRCDRSRMYHSDDSDKTTHECEFHHIHVPLEQIDVQPIQSQIQSGNSGRLTQTRLGRLGNKQCLYDFSDIIRVVCYQREFRELRWLDCFHRGPAVTAPNMSTWRGTNSMPIS